MLYQPGKSASSMILLDQEQGGTGSPGSALSVPAFESNRTVRTRTKIVKEDLNYV